MMNGVAHEFIHSFFGHQDTIDHVVKDGKMSFENQHHHCDFLNLPTPVFLTSSCHINLPFVLLHQDTFLLTTATLISQARLHTSLRGPPALA